MNYLYIFDMAILLPQIEHFKFPHNKLQNKKINPVEQYHDNPIVDFFMNPPHDSEILKIEFEIN